MAKLRIGPAGKTGSYATLIIMTQMIGGIVGKRSMEEAAHAVRNNGEIDIQNTTYGYLGGGGGCMLAHDKIDQSLYNEWVKRDLDEVIYVERLGWAAARRHLYVK